MTGFLGPNGAGKSTTMRMVLGLDAPSSGSVLVDGKPYGELADPLRSVGALLDAKAIVGGRSAANHLRWLADSNGIARHRVSDVLDIVGLSDVAAERVGTFSLGMNQRLGIAAALLGDPPTLMFDEPINGLDPDGILWIRNLMKSLAAEGRTVFLSSHLMSEMAQTADHLLVIGRGRIMADASTDDFVNGHSTATVRARALEPRELADALAGFPGYGPGRLDFACSVRVFGLGPASTNPAAQPGSTDGDSDLVDGGEGVGGVVVFCGPPWGAQVDQDVVYFVHEQAAPPLARVGQGARRARLAASLVAEHHRPARLPANACGQISRRRPW